MTVSKNHKKLQKITGANTFASWSEDMRGYDTVIRASDAWNKNDIKFGVEIRVKKIYGLAYVLESQTPLISTGQTLWMEESVTIGGFGDSQLNFVNLSDSRFLYPNVSDR